MKAINTDSAPAAVGPYSQAVIAGEFVFASGQIPLDPKTGEIVAGGIFPQAIQVLENLKSVIEAAGAQMSQVVKVTIYITDMAQFSTVNDIYARYFAKPFPARACVEVSGLPKGVEVEMDAVVHL